MFRSQQYSDVVRVFSSPLIKRYLEPRADRSRQLSMQSAQRPTEGLYATLRKPDVRIFLLSTTATLINALKRNNESHEYSHNIDL